MKTIIILVFIGLAGYTVLTTASGDNLAKTYCKKRSQEETVRRVEAGLRFRDRNMEEDNYEVCLDELDGASLGKVALKWLEPRDKAEGFLK